MAKENQIMMVFSIIGRGKSAKYMEMLKTKNIHFHFQMTAFGTAPSEMLDIFGLGNNDKDVVISLANEEYVDAYTAEFAKNLGTAAEYGGIMMTLRLSAINRLTAEIVYRTHRGSGDKGEKNKMKDKQKHQLILITVNQGYTEEVMQTAKRAGAMGGTILRARLAIDEHAEQVGELDLQREREILSILAPGGTAQEIMEAINREHGATSAANGMIISLPVDKAYKI